MASAKNEFDAIYSLKFFRHQKSWKLSTKKSKKKHTPRVEINEKKPIPSTSYCGEEWDVSDQLDIAVVEDKSEKIQTQVQPEISKYIQHVEKHVEKSPTCDDTGGIPRRKTATERIVQEEQNKLMKEVDGRDPEVYCTDYDDKPPSTPALVLSAGDTTRDDWDAAQYYTQEAEASNAVGGDCPEELVYSEPWTPRTQPSITPLPPEFEQTTADSFVVDSFEEFSRGADAASHSSEIDLPLPLWLDKPVQSFTRLARLSSKQLQLATELYSRGLRLLRMENEQRQLIRASVRLARARNNPTCELGWYEPTYDPALHLPLPGLGADFPCRGRGRLPLPGLEAGFPCRGRGRGRLSRPD